MRRTKKRKANDQQGREKPRAKNAARPGNAAAARHHALTFRLFELRAAAAAEPRPAHQLELCREMRRVENALRALPPPLSPCGD